MTTPDEMFTPKEDPEVPEQLSRDRWGRPLILPVDGGKPVAYTRASTLAKALDDMNNLVKWKARMSAWGVARSDDLIAGFASLPNPEEWDPDTKRTADQMAETAADRAGSTKRRTKGTAIHTFTETYDRGKPLEGVPDGLKVLMKNYVTATKDIEWKAFEQFVVVDEIQTAGTADRVGVEKSASLPRIFDIKSGNENYLGTAEACQLAIYARGQIYRPDGKRISYPAMDLQTGVIIHTNQDTGKVTLYDADLEFGWWAVKLALDVRKARKQKGIMVKRPEVAETKTLMQRMAAVTTLDGLNALWNETGSSWGEKEKTFASKMAAEIKARAS